MDIKVNPNGFLYHGSNILLSELRMGSTITQWEALAKAFSHKPSVLGYDDKGNIEHNGFEQGFCMF